MSPPRGTVRLEFHQGFPLEAAAALVDYFADLGLSHVTASAILAHRAGLPGGVTDHARVEPRLGGEVGLRRLVTALRRRRMGLIVDVTPGSMAAGGGDNPVWLDLLEWGRESAHAPWFDVDWRSAEASLRNKLLAPFLDQPYGLALEAGSITLAFDAARGSFHARHRDHVFPICPLDYGQILEAAALPAAAPLAEPFSRLSRMRVDPADVAAAKFRLTTLAAAPDARTAIAAALAAFDPHGEAGRTRLHRLLERQAYRLAWWGTAHDELNWRRLPTDPALAALRVERPDVFDATHAGLLQLYGEGLIDGFVIQQWDLLADPAGYARRLQLKLDGLQGQRPPDAPAGGYLIAGTAVSPEAPWPQDWEIAGTSGTEAADTLGAILHDPAAGPTLADVWAATTGAHQRYEDERAAARRQALRTSFGAELQAVARALHEVALGDLKTRDISLAALKRVAAELAIALPARRTYAGIDGFSPADAGVFAGALAKARRRISPLDQSVADRLADWLGGEPPRRLRDFEQAGAREHAIATFQQFTAALDRVATDDTLLYRYGRLVSRNEIGADPAQLGLKPAAFHARMAGRAEHGPLALTATSGPAQKRGEDARARLAVLSELPREWESLLQQLMEATRPFRTRLAEGVVPEPADAAILFQTLVGAWPYPLQPEDPLGLGDLNDRLQAWWLRMIRGARLRTGPLLGSPAYEQGCAHFLSTLMEAPAGLPARRLVAAFVARIARPGAINALSHLLLKHMAPGVPELFQGGEFWDFSLEGADATRGVDYLARSSALAADMVPERLLESYQDGRVKQATLALLLHLRSAYPALFREGDYQPLPGEGRRAEHVIAFARRHRGVELVTVATRLSAPLLGDDSPLPKVPRLRWGDTCLPLPDVLAGSYRDTISGRKVETRLGRLDLSDVLQAFPVAVLLRT